MGACDKVALGLLHVLTEMTRDGRPYEEVAQEIIGCAEKEREWIKKNWENIVTPHGTLYLAPSPNLKGLML